jgi:hypothetical protein
MTTNSLLLERFQIASGFAPSLITTARDGDYVSMRHYRRMGILFFKGIGTANQDPTITVQQATSVAGGSVKALNFTTIFTKQDPTSLADVGQWTKVTQSAGNTYTDATAAEQEVMWWIEFQQTDLDIDNNFDCLRANIGDVGTATQYGCILYIGGDPVYASKPTDMKSIIVD